MVKEAVKVEDLVEVKEEEGLEDSAVEAEAVMVGAVEVEEDLVDFEEVEMAMVVEVVKDSQAVAKAMVVVGGVMEEAMATVVVAAA